MSRITFASPLAAVAGLAALAVLASCGRGSDVPAPPEPLAPVETAERVYYDDGGGIPDSVRVVIRDRAALDDVWQRATSTQVDPPALPAVDFGRDMVLVVGAGRMSPGDVIRVDSVGVRPEPAAGGGTQQTLVALVRTTLACDPFPGDAFPLEVVRVRRFDGPVLFRERRERADCP